MCKLYIHARNHMLLTSGFASSLKGANRDAFWMSMFLSPLSLKVQSLTSPWARVTQEGKVSRVLCFIKMFASKAIPSRNSWTRWKDLGLKLKVPHRKISILILCFLAEALEVSKAHRWCRQSSQNFWGRSASTGHGAGRDPENLGSWEVQSSLGVASLEPRRTMQAGVPRLPWPSYFGKTFEHFFLHWFLLIIVPAHPDSLKSRLASWAYDLCSCCH